MKKETMKTFVALGAVLTFACVHTLQAAFIVEPTSGGKAFPNYAYLPAGGAASIGTTPAPTALGLTRTTSIYGGNGATDTYRFSYTLGTDVDNTVFSAGLQIGDNNTIANYATGQTGGVSGKYNVYATWIVSSNVSGGGTTFVVTSDGSPVSTGPINQNTGGSGSPGGNAGWFLLAGGVDLTQGNTYTVTMTPASSTFVSMRSAGVMWEMLPVPEPSTLALSIAGGLVLLVSRRRAR